MRSPDARAAGLLALVAVCGLSCASAAKPDPKARTAALHGSLADDAPAPGSFRVRLAFPEGADLDLFVTDPAQETVYFANSPSRSGGALVGDVRCGDPAPRVETVVFPDARPGRYRVGVDFAKNCDGSDDHVPFVVVVDGRGSAATRRGEIAPGVFQPIVLEVDVGIPSGGALVTRTNAVAGRGL